MRLCVDCFILEGLAHTGVVSSANISLVVLGKGPPFSGLHTGVEVSSISSESHDNNEPDTFFACKADRPFEMDNPIHK